MFTKTIDLMKEHGGLICAGFFMIFFSVFGQSVFFGVYLPHFQDDLGLSKTSLGSLYMVATIASSFAIIFTGKAIDHFPLRNVVAMTLIGLACGCFVLANAYSAMMLLIAFFLLRQFGQGLLVLTASTAVNRYLYENRGKAVALTALGGSAHMMIFPALGLYLDEFVHWRDAWLYFGLFALCFLLPVFWFYLRTHQSTTHARWETRTKAESEKAVEAIEQDWTRKNVLSDWRFYALALIIIISPFTGTAILFYQREIAASLNLEPIVFAGSLPFFTVASIIFSLFAGFIIDKYSEKLVLISYPILYAIGLIFLSQGSTLPVNYLGMVFLGGANGMAMTIGGPILAQLYGTKNLGSIKSLLFSINILASALSPFIFGLFMDMGYDILLQLSLVIFYAGSIWILAFPVCKSIKMKREKTHEKHT